MKKGRTKKFFQRFWAAFWRPEMLVLPGQIAFNLFLSLVPTITLIGYACTYLNISNELISTLLQKGLNNNFAELLTPILTDTKITPTFFITLGVGYFIASNGMSSIIVASNTIYGIGDSGFFKRRLKALLMELVIVLLLLFVLLVPLLGDSIINMLHYFNLSANSTAIIVNVLNFLSSPFSWLVIFIFIKTIYTMAPDKKVPSRSVNGGAIFTTLGWILITAVYSYYINTYANYSVFYGSLANIVMLMLWVYLLSYILVIGMAMNYHEELEKTGVMKVKKLIEESANSASVFPNEKEVIQEEKNEEIPDVVQDTTPQDENKEQPVIQETENQPENKTKKRKNTKSKSKK